MVKILIGNVTSRIIGYLPNPVHNAIDKKLSYIPKGVQHIKSVKEGRWDGRFRLYRKSHGQFFDTGLLSLVTSILDQFNVEYSKVDERKRPATNLPDLKFEPFPGYEERDYQQFTIDRAYNRTRGVLKVATGGGKTNIVAELISRIKTGPFMFYVLTKDLMEQAYDSLSLTLNEPIGRIGGGKWDIQNINVCTIQTVIRAVNLRNKKFKISDYKFDEEDLWSKKDIESEDRLQILRQLLKATKGIYFDECHHAAARTVKDTLQASPNAFWRYGGSATPYREDGAEIMIQALFGRKIVDISASYLIDNGYLIEPYVVFEPIFHDCKLHAYPSIYSECVSKNDDFNMHVADTANFLVEHDLSTMVIVQHIHHGKFLQKHIPGSVFVSGGLGDTKRKEAIQDLRDKKIMCMVATCLADEGLDIPTLDVALLAGGGASATRIHQRIGRTLRKDRNAKNPRDRSLVVCYQHDAKYLKKHANKARQIVKSEPRFNIVRSKGRNQILGEISEVMDLNYRQKNIFDL